MREKAPELLSHVRFSTTAIPDLVYEKQGRVGGKLKRESGQKLEPQIARENNPDSEPSVYRRGSKRDSS